MTNSNKNASSLSNRAGELRTELARKIASFIGPKEKLITDVPGLLLTRRTAPTAPATATYEPSLAVVAQGRKRATLAGTTFIFDESRYLLTSLDLPVICNVIEASEEVPYLCFVLKLEMPVVRELLSREEIQAPEVASDNPAMATGETTAELLDACCRLVDLLNTPQDIPFLSGLIQREIIYRILRGPGGAPSSDCNAGRSEPPDGKGDRVDQGELREAATGGRSRRNRGHGRVHAAPPFPGADRHESSSVSEAASVAGSAGTHAHGWSGRRQCGLRGRIRKRQPIQSRIQPLLRPTAHAGYSDSSLSRRSAVGVGE